MLVPLVLVSKRIEVQIELRKVRKLKSKKIKEIAGKVMNVHLQRLENHIFATKGRNEVLNYGKAKDIVGNDQSC